MSGGTRVRLPNGFWVDGSRHLDAQVRPLTGLDEEFLLDGAVELAPAARATALLARCVLRLGPVDPVREDDIRALTIGDREALLLDVHQLTFGDRIQSTVSCPSCGERLDLDFLSSDVRVPTRPEATSSYEVRLEMDDGAYRIRFRLPTGADQEAAVAAVADDIVTGVQTGVHVLLERCVEEVRRDETPIRVGDLPPPLIAALSECVAECDPQAEVELVSECLACRHSFRTLLDAGAFLFQEVGMRLRGLYQEVHTLALHYHWSEGEILSMTSAKRRRYLGLLSESLQEQWRA
jgi:hypothetical protein